MSLAATASDRINNNDEVSKTVTRTTHLYQVDDQAVSFLGITFRNDSSQTHNLPLANWKETLGLPDDFAKRDIGTTIKQIKIYPDRLFIKDDTPLISSTCLM